MESEPKAVPPLIAEQYRETRMKVRTLRGGERVIVDPAVTVQSIYMIFYMCINVGSLSSIATTELEQHVGFWAAYLLPFLVFFVGVGGVPRGVWRHAGAAVDGSVCRGAEEGAGGVPGVYLFSGILDCLWPDDEQLHFTSRNYGNSRHPERYHAKHRPPHNHHLRPHRRPDRLPAPPPPQHPFRPISRITVGFLLASLSMAYAVIVQHIIYTSPPCYTTPLAPLHRAQQSPRRRPNTRLPLHRPQRDLCLHHGARVRVHQGAARDEVLRDEHVPADQRARKRDRHRAVAHRGGPEAGVDVYGLVGGDCCYRRAVLAVL